MKGEAVLVSIVAAVIVVLKERTEGFMSVSKDWVLEREYCYLYSTLQSFFEIDDTEGLSTCKTSAIHMYTGRTFIVMLM